MIAHVILLKCFCLCFFLKSYYWWLKSACEWKRDNYSFLASRNKEKTSVTVSQEEHFFFLLVIAHLLAWGAVVGCSARTLLSTINGYYLPTQEWVGIQNNCCFRSTVCPDLPVVYVLHGPNVPEKHLNS